MTNLEKTSKLQDALIFIEFGIITGLEALGRGHDLVKLQSFVQDLTHLGAAMPELLARLNPQELIKRLATARGLDCAGLIRSDEELQALQAQSMQAQGDQSQGGLPQLNPQGGIG